MDASTLATACKKVYFKNRFKGIIFADASYPKKLVAAIGEFYIINTDHLHGGEHWFSLIRGFDMWILFDCSVSTPLFAYQAIISRLSLPCIIDRKYLEGVNSLLCGEFALMAIILMSKTIYEAGDRIKYNNYPRLFYSKIILAYTKSNKQTADEFVYDFIYRKMRHILHIHPERESEVIAWLNAVQ